MSHSLDVSLAIVCCKSALSVGMHSRSASKAQRYLRIVVNVVCGLLLAEMSHAHATGTGA